MIYTHSHIYGPEYAEDRAEVIARAIEIGVEKHLLANVDSTTIHDLLLCHQNYPEFTAMAMGLHPTSVTDSWKKELRIIEDTLRTNNNFVALGEI